MLHEEGLPVQPDTLQLLPPSASHAISAFSGALNADKPAIITIADAIWAHLRTLLVIMVP